MVAGRPQIRTAQSGPGEDERLMPPTTPTSLAARERLRDHQASAVKAVALHSSASARLEAVISRRTEVVAAQDTLVAAAKSEVAAAVVVVVQVMGIETAAAVLDLTKAEVRRLTNETEGSSR
jgi:hypothetical protein